MFVHDGENSIASNSTVQIVFMTTSVACIIKTKEMYEFQNSLYMMKSTDNIRLYIQQVRNF